MVPATSAKESKRVKEGREGGGHGVSEGLDKHLCGPSPGSITVALELVGNANFRPVPRPAESESLKTS